MKEPTEEHAKKLAWELAKAGTDAFCKAWDEISETGFKQPENSAKTLKDAFESGVIGYIESMSEADAKWLLKEFACATGIKSAQNCITKHLAKEQEEGFNE